MPQEALGGQYDQWLAPLGLNLSAEQVEVLSWGRWLSDDDVVFGRQEQQAFEPGAAVLGALAFEPVRQEHHESA